METTIAVALIFSAFFGELQQTTSVGRWLKLFVAPNGIDVFLDTETYKTTLRSDDRPLMKTGWVKWVLPEARGDWMIQFRIDCDNRKILLEQIDTFSSGGVPFDSAPTGQWASIVPETGFDILRANLCP